MTEEQAPQRRSHLPKLPGASLERLRPGGLILDELTEQLDRTRRLLADSPEGAAEAALSRLHEEEAERRIAAGMAERAPLAEPERFPEAHRLAIHALEILDREGSRDPKVWRLGPFTGLAQVVVEFVAEYLVKSFASDIVGRLRSLYARREAQCVPATPERRMLARSRMEMDRLAPGFNGGGIGAPILIVGGLLVPALASLSNYLGAIDFTNRRIVLGGLFLLFIVALSLSSAVLRGAAVAHRRSQLIMGQPLAALWETLGNAGTPPEDDSVLFASIAVLVTALVWFVLPAAAAIVYVVL
jgi:hypothetical protein